MKPKIGIALALVTVALLAIVAGCQTKGGSSRTEPQTPTTQDGGGGSGTKPAPEGSGTR